MAKSLRLAAVLGAFVCATLLWASSGGTAIGAVTHQPEPFSPIDGGASQVDLEELSAVAIDEETGNVFVANGALGHRSPGNEVVAILGGEGGTPVGLAAPYVLTGFTFSDNDPSQGVAYDNSPTSPSRGTLYIADLSSSAVKRFHRNNSTNRYEFAGELQISNGDGGNVLSTDAAGNLYVSTKNPVFEGAAVLYKFSPLGVLLAEYDFPPRSPFRNPGQVAVDSHGDLFLTPNQSGLFELPANDAGEIDPGVYTEISPEPAGGVAINPVTQRIYVSFPGKSVLVEYNTSGDRLGEFGSDVPTMGLPRQVAFDQATDRIYVTDAAANIGGHSVVNVFGPPLTVPTLTVGDATEVTGTKATLNGSINPEGLAVTDCFFEWGPDNNGKPQYSHSVPCEGTIGQGADPEPVTAQISGLTPNGATYHFRLIAENANGTERTVDGRLTTGDTVTTGLPTRLTQESGTLNGVVRPEGVPFTNCVFEYGLTSAEGFEHQAPCQPSAGSINPDFLSHSVSLPITDLQPNAEYKVRLTASNSGGSVSGQTLIFRTLGSPRIDEVRAVGADQTWLTLEARIDPRGFGTTYLIEWGPTDAYGTVARSGSLAAGEGPTRVSVQVAGLTVGTRYHYRIVATNRTGTTTSGDRAAETLNECGLPEARCLELVAPSGPVGVGRAGEVSQFEPTFQASEREGSVVFNVASGFIGSTKGGEVGYSARRGASQWNSEQFAAPLTATNETNAGSSVSSITVAISNDLDCAVVQSNQSLAGGASSRIVLEAGGYNLYRRDSAGAYRAITEMAPENPEAAEGQPRSGYAVAGMSADCGKVVFASEFRYPGIVASEASQKFRSQTYEWSDGTLRNAGILPTEGGGEIIVPSTPGGLLGGQFNPWNSVSENGERVFFSASRLTSPNPEEKGKVGVFVREGGRVTRDLSKSETATPDLGAEYMSATPDGSRVYFLANAGLTADSSSEGTDLYEYDLEKAPSDHPLRDLSVDRSAGGASVGAFLGAAADGSRVYFVARGQLVPGRGPTFAENRAAKTYSVYEGDADDHTFIGTMPEQEVVVFIINNLPLPTAAQVSPDGRYLLFRSSAQVTDYQSHGVPEAYLFDARGGPEPVRCVSCRQDGLPPRQPTSETESVGEPISALRRENNPLHAPHNLVVRGGEPLVFFTSRDQLAPGSVEGISSLYEWAHGQVFRVMSEPIGLQRSDPGQNKSSVYFGDANVDGTDLYFSAPQLQGASADGIRSVYDARIGGGFPEGSPVASPCDPALEGSCQHPAGPPLAAPGPATANFNGSGNAEKKSKGKHKKHKKKHHKKKGQHKKKSRGGKHKQGSQHAGGSRRASK